MIALVLKRTRWSLKRIRKMDRSRIFALLFHPEKDNGELEIRRTQGASQPSGDPAWHLYRLRGWPDHLIAARLAGEV